ncbi:MAG: virulence RhuM family protein [Oscillospiraceae bacterium]|jgi:hypothetical protein|nr:virulence RhuM family protein [Oscillospiraceae bacterium]
MKNEIILYRPDEHTNDSHSEVMHIEVRFDEDTVWLTQQQIAALFNRSKQNISLHINNCYREKELNKNSTVKEYLTVQKEGYRTVNRNVEHYNLDVIISVGYRVKSTQGTQFRIWATSKLKDYLLKGYAINNRLNRIEDNADILKNRVDELELQLNINNIPMQGVFFDGQMFDAYELVSRIIRSAKQSIILIDNYIDETTLVHLAKKNKDVKVLLLTQCINKQLNLDIQKANSQYGGFIVKKFNKSHDRFLIIDSGKEIYHIGASLKDLGKKWFAFSKLGKESIAGILTAVLKLV